jgi:hypothetical protein
MKKLICIALSILSTSVFAVASETPEQILASSKDYCYATGGTVVPMVAEFDTHAGYVKGITKDFCKYQNHENVGYVGLETLSTTPTLAATYTRKLVVTQERLLPTKPYKNPALNVCQLLHGSEIVFSVIGGGFNDSELGETDICVFGDGSSISAWTMIYAAVGVRKDIKRFIRSKPLNINIPSVQ